MGDVVQIQEKITLERPLSLKKTYTKYSPSLNSIFQRHWELTNNDRYLYNLLPNSPNTAYRNRKTLKPFCQPCGRNFKRKESKKQQNLWKLKNLHLQNSTSNNLCHKNQRHSFTEPYQKYFIPPPNPLPLHTCLLSGQIFTYNAYISWLFFLLYQSIKMSDTTYVLSAPAFCPPFHFRSILNPFFI